MRWPVLVLLLTACGGGGRPASPSTPASSPDGAPGGEPGDKPGGAPAGSTAQPPDAGTPLDAAPPPDAAPAGDLGGTHGGPTDLATPPALPGGACSTTPTRVAAGFRLGNADDAYLYGYTDRAIARVPLAG